MKLIHFDSYLWDDYTGAYGNVKDDVALLMGKEEDVPEQFRIQRLYREEKTNYEIVFENLCENLWHQLSFYYATYLVLPYLVTLLERKEAEQDFIWQFRFISEMGSFLAMDIPSNHNPSKAIDAEVLENYYEAVFILQEKTKIFIEKYTEEIKQCEPNNLSYFCVAVLAILGDREAAFILTNLMFDLCYVICKNCKDCNEEINAISDGDIKEIVPAESVIGKWDGTSYQDTYLWFSNLLYKLGDYTSLNALSYYYGTYTCPKCGEKDLVMDLVKNYYFNMD